MQYSVSAARRSTAITAGLLAVVAACSDSSPTTPTLPSSYLETKLVSDDPSLGAAVVDPNLVNPWGIAFSSGGTLWISDNGTHLSTLYNAAGTKLALVVNIPKAGGSPGGFPTGQVFNSTTDFLINGGSKAAFIFAGEDGTISGWSSGTNAVVVADRSGSDAVY